MANLVNVGSESKGLVFSPPPLNKGGEIGEWNHGCGGCI